jgi:hypothetical protein
VVFPYNDRMNDEKHEEREPAEEVVEEQREAKPDLPPEFVAARASQATRTKWDSGPRPGKWTTIGCGLGIVILIAALFAGSSLLRKTVWSGYAGTCNRLTANLPLDLAPGERMRLTRNLDRLTTLLRQMEEPFETMGEFQRIARKALQDRSVSHDEVEEINLFIEAQLAENTLSVPYSMP